MNQNVCSTLETSLSIQGLSVHPTAFSGTQHQSSNPSVSPVASLCLTLQAGAIQALAVVLDA